MLGQNVLIRTIIFGGKFWTSLYSQVQYFLAACELFVNYLVFFGFQPLMDHGHNIVGIRETILKYIVVVSGHCRWACELKKNITHEIMPWLIFLILLNICLCTCALFVYAYCILVYLTEQI